jgi:hypothetical protein
MFFDRSDVLICCALAALVVGGCASTTEWVKVRDTPRNPLAGTLDLVAPGGPKPTDRTMQLLRRYDLEGDLKGDRAALLARLEEIQRREPEREHEYAMAEIAYITATQSEKLHRQKALEFYGTALTHAYQYLFEQEEAGSKEAGAWSKHQRNAIRETTVPGSTLHAPSSPLNPYDPQFRGASDLYNQSLEGLLRLVRQEGELRPGMSRTVKTASHTCDFEVVMRGSAWHADDIDRLEFVSDYQVKGLRNHYHYYGLGVPLIAVRRDHAEPDKAERYYPPKVCFPITAFLRVDRPVQRNNRAVSTPLNVDPAAPRFVLELYDSLDRQSIDVAGRDVPVE